MKRDYTKYRPTTEWAKDIKFNGAWYHLKSIFDLDSADLDFNKDIESIDSSNLDFNQPIEFIDVESELIDDPNIDDDIIIL